MFFSAEILCSFAVCEDSLNKCGYLGNSAVMALPAFAAERRAAAPLLLDAGAVDRQVLPCPRGTQQQTGHMPQWLLTIKKWSCQKVKIRRD